jgi:hypothetical protein
MTHNRRGFALPAAIGGLVIVGVLVTAGFYMARQEVRIGVASRHAALAVNVAQTGASEIMADWYGYKLAGIPVWGDTTIVDTLDSGVWTVGVINLNNRVYFLSAQGEITEGGALWSGATRNIGIVTRMITPNLDPPAAITTRGATTVRGSAQVIGYDTDPPGWDASFCPKPLDDKIGVLTNDTSELRRGGRSSVSGDPPWAQDSTIVDSTFTHFGDMQWAELVALAKEDGKEVTGLGSSINQTLPDSVGTVCTLSTLTNWGDPRDPQATCGSYFPLVYHAGPKLTIQSGGYGQGILLVDGDLDLRGNFVYHGVIIVQGTFEAQGAGNRIFGSVLASNANFDSQSLAGASIIQASTCAVERAILNNAALSRVRPLETRSWIDLSGVVTW